MMRVNSKTRLQVSTAIIATFGSSTAIIPHQVLAQTVADQELLTEQASAPEGDNSPAIIVTGSRIRRSETTTSAPVSVIGQQELLDRGYVQVGDALNKLTSNSPMFAVAPGDGDPAGSGQQYPNLFNLGAGRTLSLINGRRAAPSAEGSGVRVLDTNTIPTGLIERVDVVQGGGAAVYGSDAIAGVVNYVLKQDFQGVTIDAQNGNSWRMDYGMPSLRVTAGTNFAGGRGNIAANIEYSKTMPLYFGSRPATNPITRQLSNPLNETLDDGIPSRTPVRNPHFWASNVPGVLFVDEDAFSLSNLLGYRVDGQDVYGYQFSPSGQDVVPYYAGRRFVEGYDCSYPFCEGGDGYPYSRIASLYSGVERLAGTALGHYDLTDRLKLSAEFTYARTKGVDAFGTQAPTDYVDFTIDNPYLTPSAIATLTELQPGFETGTPVHLEKTLENVVRSRELRFSTETYRGVVALDGDFDIGDRNFYYNAFYSRSVVEGRTRAFATARGRLANSLNATRNDAGQIVCSVNADASTDNDDAACIPINPFGSGPISQEALQYLTVDSGSTFRNTQDDFLASLGGSLFKLPGGDFSFSVSYEHRAETARFTPSADRQSGLAFDTPEPATFGKFNTDELAGEVLIPLVGGDFTLPLIKALEINAQFRSVDNSIAGRENVWGVGGRWEIGGGLTLRASRSRNFRAPTLTQLFASRSTNLGGGVEDPCDVRIIDAGPNPSTRMANCQALFAANPGYGPLSGFEQIAYNSGDSTMITTGGNPNLRNEISKTTTFGLVWQPRYVPGSLTVVADHVAIDLKDGLTAFEPSDFAQACFDASPQPQDICSTFTRDSAGTIVTALSTTFNAASVRYRGEVYKVNYRFPLAWIFGEKNTGSMEFDFDATHNRLLETVVASVTTPMQGTTMTPKWVLRGEVRYKRGPLGVSYEVYHMPAAKVNFFDTIENTAFPRIAANTRHSISASYDIGKNYQIRAGVNNFTDRGPSFPTLNYGDILGRQWFIGVRASY